MIERPKLLREILWTSDDGQYAVVRGPFPAGFVRSIDTNYLDRAKDRANRTVISRPATTTEKFAKVRMRDLAPTMNEYGELCP